MLSGALHPHVIEVVKTYCDARSVEVTVVPPKGGKTDMEGVKDALKDDVACLCFQQPGYYGIIEDAEALCALAHEAGAKSVMYVNPIAMALLKTPAECGADIAVGEGQPLGIPMSLEALILALWQRLNAMRLLAGSSVRRRTAAAAALLYRRFRQGNSISGAKGLKQHLYESGSVRHDGERLHQPPWDLQVSKPVRRNAIAKPSMPRIAGIDQRHIPCYDEPFFMNLLRRVPLILKFQSPVGKGGHSRRTPINEACSGV